MVNTPRTPPRTRSQTASNASAASQTDIAAIDTTAVANAVAAASFTTTATIERADQQRQDSSNLMSIDAGENLLLDLGSSATVTDPPAASAMSAATPATTGAPSATATVPVATATIDASTPTNPALQEALLSLSEARAMADDFFRELTSMKADFEAERAKRRELEEAFRLRTVEERNLAAALHVRDTEVIELRREVDQFRKRSNQLSHTPSLLTQPQLYTNTQIHTPTGPNNNSTLSTDMGLGYTLKVDKYDGKAPLCEFLCQFELIAKANTWHDEKKMVALASCLRDDARSVLRSYSKTETITFNSLVGKLQERFGDKHLESISYPLFHNRCQKVGEDFPTLAADIERLATLAYSECSPEVQDKIACSQFISAIYNKGIKEILQLEKITSLKIALSRAQEIKTIRDQNRISLPNKTETKTSQIPQNSSDTKANHSGKSSGEQAKSFSVQDWLKNVECYTCKQKGHIRSHCPNNNQGN